MNSSPGFRAYGALATLTAINLLNYSDRYVLAGMLDSVKTEFTNKPWLLGTTVDDFAMGVLLASFLVVYSIASPITGVLGDRFPRKWFIGGGVLLWSAATVWSGHAHSFNELLLARSTIGIGEAGYAAMAPSFIADLFDKDRRGRMLSIFYAALPVGIAIGYAAGDIVGKTYGWRSAFYVAGLPGFVVGALSLILREPTRGENDEGAARASHKAPVLEIARTLVRTPSYLFCTFGMAAMTFAMGGLGGWMPTYLERERHVGEQTGGAGRIFGLLLIVAGFAATLAGGWAGDQIQKRHKGGYFIISGIGLGLGVPCAVVSALAPQPGVYWTAIFLALFFLFLNTGPLNAALVNVVPANMRASAVAVNVLVIHALGDVASPILIGKVSDVSSLKTAILLNSVMIAVSAAILLSGANALRRDLTAITSPSGAAPLPH